MPTVFKELYIAQLNTDIVKALMPLLEKGNTSLFDRN